MSKSIVYALHPGEVTSINDGDIHFITAGQLAKLYRLDPGEYIIWTEENSRGHESQDYIHLYPKHNGVYGRPLHLQAEGRACEHDRWGYWVNTKEQTAKPRDIYHECPYCKPTEEKTS